MREKAPGLRLVSGKFISLNQWELPWHCRGHRFDPGWLHQFDEGHSRRRLGPSALLGRNSDAPEPLSMLALRLGGSRPVARGAAAADSPIDFRVSLAERSTRKLPQSPVILRVQ
jgi:hypothetical protein